tara:strand:+ start:716 stop:919 length:204 start_codon:yes stop_codon:yes gene_type:complete
MGIFVTNDRIIRSASFYESRYCHDVYTYNIASKLSDSNHEDGVQAMHNKDSNLRIGSVQKPKYRMGI